MTRSWHGAQTYQRVEQQNDVIILARYSDFVERNALSGRHMKTSIYEKLREEGYDVHRCAPGSDSNCYYLVSHRRDRDYKDKDGRIFKAVRETPAGNLEIGATLAFFVSRSAQATAKTKALMGDFESFLVKAGVAHLRELLEGDLSGTPHRDIELHSRSPDDAFIVPAEPDPLAELRDLRFRILRILAEKHSAGSKRVSKDALLEELCTNIDWVDRVLGIVERQKYVDGALRGEMKLLPAGYLEAEKTLPQPAPAVAPKPEPVRDEDAPTTAAAEAPENAAVEETARHAFDLFICYASEDRSTVEGLVAVLDGRGLKVWWDKGQVTLGDRLSAKIDEGLSNSRYGVVVISSSSIAKPWPESELRSMINRSISKAEKVILPVLLNLTHSQFAEHYPLIADTVTTQFDDDLDRLADEISTAIGWAPPESSPTVPSNRTSSTDLAGLPDLRHPHGETVSSFLNNGDLLARLIPHGNVEKASDVVWTNRPQAFLRLVPTVPISPLTPKEVYDLIFSPPYALLPFGNPTNCNFEANEFGAVVFDAQAFGQTSASEIAQVFENGEVWGIDAAIFEPEKNGQRGIPSIAIEEQFEQALAAFLTFARDHAGLSVPLRLIAGIDGVKGYPIFVRRGLAGNIVKDHIVHETCIVTYDEPTHHCLLPFFKRIWAFAGLDRPDDLREAG